jgi:ABC-2 type transport system ATP-binding protein
MVSVRSHAVTTSGITKRFGDRTVVDRLDLDIPVGSVCGFVGPNGAGKTTTIRMLLGLIRPTEGSGTVLGQPVEEPASYLHRVGALIEAPAFYPGLSGRDNLGVLAQLGRLPMTVVDPALERVGLGDRASQLFKRYSLGMKQRLGIAAALLVQPELVILDEPANGLDPAGMLEMRQLMRSLALDGTTVFVSSHLLAEVEQICDHLVMIREGRLVFQGSVDELYASQRPELVLRPEHARDLHRLVALLVESGRAAHIDGDGLTVVVQSEPAAAAALNRLAMANQITLCQLSARDHSLEEAFLALTGTQPGDGDPSEPVARSGQVGLGAVR